MGALAEPKAHVFVLASVQVIRLGALATFAVEFMLELHVAAPLQSAPGNPFTLACLHVLHRARKLVVETPHVFLKLHPPRLIGVTKKHDMVIVKPHSHDQDAITSGSARRKTASGTFSRFTPPLMHVPPTRSSVQDSSTISVRQLCRQVRT